MSYQLILDVNSPSGQCDGIDTALEAIELSIRNDSTSNRHWVPLQLTYYDDSAVSDTSTLEMLRGYDIPVHQSSTNMTTDHVSICGDVLLSNEVQFRWIGTAQLEGSFASDMWALASVNATLITQDDTATLIHDIFGGDALE